MAQRDLADAAAIGVSAICLLHCLAAPVVLSLAPWLVPAIFSDERFHLVAVAVALPISIIALVGTLDAHPRTVATAAAGLAALLLATLLPHEAAEVVVTVCGASLLVLAHARNILQRAATPPV